MCSSKNNNKNKMTLAFTLVTKRPPLSFQLQKDPAFTPDTVFLNAEKVLSKPISLKFTDF